ncbi:MAG: tRNA epoxyqueuosine(34) reductase QueG, partial [Anaerolineae bacterium]|nr:tRNA epoxyqueuosine(34) reductase QueG [Anaerolineae bacterium]
MPSLAHLSVLVKEYALELGFDLVGIAPATRVPHGEAYVAWIEAGYAGTMAYMARDPARRQDPRCILPEARSVVVVALSYFAGDPPAALWDEPARGRIARYAWGRDYHDVLLPRLRRLAGFLQQCVDGPVAWRAYVDTGPLLERDLALLAGLGFIGKNTCLIHPEWGSYLFLGELLVDVELTYDAPITTGTCGRCNRCLDACPTGALVAPYQLDSRKCISYLTIELRDAIPEALRVLMGNWVFGCDVCQSVCPWTRRFAHVGRQDFLVFEPGRCVPSLLELLEMDEAQFRARFGRTPVRRSKWQGLRRNVAVALGNWGDPVAIPAL